MNKKITSIATACAAFFMPALFGTNAVSAQEQQVAFPGAEGFGKYTTGGRGGAVYHVTSLEDDGSEGTLRWAIGKSGARTIVFDVSGTIYLKSALDLRNGNVTIAGQTAPGDGICVADYPFTIKASNVIMRYVRFRLGNRQVANHEGDGLGGMDQKNIIVDHCSVSWSIDECLSVYGSKDISVQWCIVSQSLNNAGHAKGAHGYGGNWGGSGASYHHNLLVHHNSRTPRLGPRPGTQKDERMDFRNNVIYNWAGNGCYGGEGMNVNIVNNYYKPGPGTRTRSAGIQKRIAAPGIRTTEYCKITKWNADGTPADGNDWAAMWHKWGAYYLDGNVNPDYEDVTKDNWKYGLYDQIDKSGNDGMLRVSATNPQEKVDSVIAHIHATVPTNFEGVTTHTAEKAFEKVLAYAGASFHRDAHDALMVADTRDGKASYTGGKGTSTPGMIDNQDVMIGYEEGNPSAWPMLKSQPAPTDTDQDGMPDEWETANGLDPNDANDRNTVGKDGYTMLETYMNSLVADITAGQLADGIYTEQLKAPEVPAPVGTSTITWTLADKTNYTIETTADNKRKVISTLIKSGVASDDIKSSVTVKDVTLGESLGFVQSGIIKTVGTEETIVPMMGISTTVNNAPSADKSNAVSFAFNVADGKAFTPSSISYVISKAGTDGVLYDVTMTANGKTVTLETAQTPNRNNETGGWYTTKTTPLENAIVMTGDVVLNFNIYKMGDTKTTLIRDVVITGIVTSSNSSALRNEFSRNDATVDVYSLNGNIVRKNVRMTDIRKIGLPKGIYIAGGRKIMVK